MRVIFSDSDGSRDGGSNQRQRQEMGQRRRQIREVAVAAHLRVVHGVMGIAGEGGGVKDKPASAAGRSDP